jgi:hypothetical protein
MLTKEDFVGTNGREVLIRGVIQDENPDNLWGIVNVILGGEVHAVMYSSVHSILPKRLMVGDTVYFNALPGIVRYIQGDKVLVDWGEGIGLNIEKRDEL